LQTFITSIDNMLAVSQAQSAEARSNWNRTV